MHFNTTFTLFRANGILSHAFLVGHALVTTKDAGDAVALLQSLSGSTFDSSQLVLTACMGYLAVTEARLQELREKHRPAVLGVIEERSKGGRVWKDSKGLASKLYSFKHDPRPLIKATNTEGSDGKHTDRDQSPSTNLDGFLEGLTVNSEADSVPDLQEQVAKLFLKIQNTSTFFVGDLNITIIFSCLMIPRAKTCILYVVSSL